MTESLHDNRRLAKNSLALFIRMIVLMCISLYTSRVVLQALGVSDMGIFNVVGGFVSMFSIISNSLSSSISRYLTIALGEGNEKKMSIIFSTSLNMIYLICLFLLIVLETFGLWFVNYKMTIPTERIVAANWVFQISILTFFIDIICLPYNAITISHERMTAFAYIGIFEAVGKLCAALLIAVSPFDKLVFYSLLLAIVAIIVRIIYTAYCRINFPESKYHFTFNKSLMKEMFGFSGWNFFGIFSSMLADQGVNMMLNVFFGPIVNAARGIAMQVSSAVGSLCGSFTTAINPQITKSYAADERDYYIQLCDRGARFSYYLYFIIALPVLFTAPILMKLWLGVVPDHTVNFVRLVLLSSFFSLLSSPLVTLLMATGEIRIYQLLVGGFRFIVLPLCWLLLKLGLPPESVFIVSIVTELCCLSLRLLRLKIQIDFPVRKFIEKTIGTILFVTIASIILPYFVNIFFTQKWVNFICVLITCVLSTCSVIYFKGIDNVERIFIRNKILQFKHLIR